MGEDTGPPATLILVQPADGATICGDPLVVEIAVEDFELIPIAEGEDPGRPGGHVDVYLNGQDALMLDHRKGEILDVADGVYQIKAELSNADHSPIKPYTNALAYVTVDATACEAP